MMSAKNLPDTVNLHQDIRAKPQRSTKNTIDHNIHGTSTFPPVVDKRDSTPNVKQNSDGWKATDPTTDRGGARMTSDSDVTPSFASQQIIAEDTGDRADTLNHRQTRARRPSTGNSTTTTSPSSSDTIKKFDFRPKDPAFGTSRNDASVPIEIEHNGLMEQSTHSDVGTTETIGNLHRGIEPVPDPPRAESKLQNDSQDTHVLPSALTELGLGPAHGGSPPVVGLTPWQEIVKNVRNNSRKPARRPRRTRRPQSLALGNIIPDSTGVGQRSSEIAVTDTNNHSEKSSPSRIPNETTPESTNLINDPTLHQESVSTRPKALSEDPIRRETPPGEPSKRPIATDNAIQELPIIMRPSQSTISNSPKEGHDISPPTTGELPVPEKLTQSISPNHYFAVEPIGDSEAVGIDLVAPPKQPPPIQNKTSHDLQTHNQEAAPADNAPAQNQPNASEDLNHASGVNALRHLPAHQSTEEAANPLGDTETASDELHTSVGVMLKNIEIGDGGPTLTLERSDLAETDRECSNTHDQDAVPNGDAPTQNQPNLSDHGHAPGVPDETTNLLENAETTSDMKQTRAPHQDSLPTENVSLELQSPFIDVNNTIVKQDVANSGATSAPVEKSHLLQTVQEFTNTHDQIAAPTGDAPIQNQPNVSDHSHAPEAHASHQPKEETDPLENTETTLCLDNGLPTEKIPLESQPTSVELDTISDVAVQKLASVEKAILGETDQEHPGARGQDVAPGDDALTQNQSNALYLDNDPPIENIPLGLQPTSVEPGTILVKLDVGVQKSASVEKAILEETGQERPGARPAGDTLAQNQSNVFPLDNSPPVENISPKLQPTSDEPDTILEKPDVAATTVIIQTSTSAENPTLAETVQDNSNTRGQDAAPTSDAPTENQPKVSEQLSHVHTSHQLPAHQSKEETTNPPENTEIAANTHFPVNSQPTGNLTPRLQPTPVDLDTILEGLDVVATMATLQASTSVENATSVETVQEYSNTRGQVAVPAGEAPAQNQSNAPYLDNGPPTEDISLEWKPTSAVDVDAILVEKLDIPDDVPTAIETLTQVEKSPVAETIQEYSNNQDAALTDNSPTQDQSNISKDLSHAPVIHVSPQLQAHQSPTNSSQNTETAPDTEQTHTPHLDNNQLTEDLSRLQPTPVDLDTILGKLDVAAFTIQPSTSAENVALVETVQNYPNTRGQDTVSAGEGLAQNQPKAPEDLSHAPAEHGLPAQRPQEEETSSFENIETTSDIQQTHTLYPDNSQPTEVLSPGLQRTPVDPDAVLGKLDSADGAPTTIETSTLVEKSQPAILHNHEGTKSTEIPTNLEVTPSTLLLGPDITRDKHTGVTVENTDADAPTLDNLTPQTPVHSKEISLLAETSPYNNYGVPKLDHNIQDSVTFEAINTPVPRTEDHNTSGTTVIVGNRTGEVEESTYEKPPVIMNVVSDAYAHRDITPSGQSGITIQSTETPAQNMITTADRLDTTHPETVLPTLSTAQVPLPDGGADTPIVQSHTPKPSLSPVNDGSTQSLASTPVGFHVQYVPRRSHNYIQYYYLHFLTYIKTIEYFNKRIISAIRSMGLERFYPRDNPRLLELSKMAATLALDKSSELSAPECIVNLTSLALFDKILYLGMLLQQKTPCTKSFDYSNNLNNLGQYDPLS